MALLKICISIHKIDIFCFPILRHSKKTKKQKKQKKKRNSHLWNIIACPLCPGVTIVIKGCAYGLDPTTLFSKHPTGAMLLGHYFKKYIKIQSFGSILTRQQQQTIYRSLKWAYTQMCH